MCQQFDFCALHNPFLIYVQRLSSSTWLWLQLPETICFSFLILFFYRIKGLKSNMSNQLDVAKFDQTLTDFLNVAGCKTLQYLSLKMFLWLNKNCLSRFHMSVQVHDNDIEPCLLVVLLTIWSKVEYEGQLKRWSLVVATVTSLNK